MRQMTISQWKEHLLGMRDALGGSSCGVQMSLNDCGLDFESQTRQFRGCLTLNSDVGGTMTPEIAMTSCASLKPERASVQGYHREMGQFLTLLEEAKAMVWDVRVTADPKG